MTRSGIRWMAASLSMIATPAIAQGTLHVDITEGIASPLPIAIPQVASGPLPGVTVGEDIGIALSHILREDLLSTGLYRLIEVEGNLSADQEVVFAPSRRAGAQALVIGRASKGDDGSLAYECTLYDVFGARTEASQHIRVSMTEWRRAAHKCADMVFSSTTGDPGHFDTRLLFVADDGGPSGQEPQLVVADYDGANAQAVTRGLDLAAMPSFSPDGSRVVFISYAELQPKLVVADLVSGQSSVISIPAGVPSAPRISPDGRTVVLSLARDGDADIYAVNVATGFVRRLTDTVGADTSPSYAPDGALIVFESDRSGEQQLYVMGADGSGQRRISFGQGGYASPAWSPRDNRIAFTKIERGSLRIGVMRPDGSHERIITDGSHDEDPSWAISGRAIAFQRSAVDQPRPSIWITDLTGNAQHQVRVAGAASDPDWSGRRP